MAIAPIPDDVLGERASCFVVLKNGASLRFDELKAFLSERKFAKFTWPEQLAIVADMPVTPTRKIKRTLMYEKFKALVEAMYDDREERLLAREVGDALRS